MMNIMLSDHPELPFPYNHKLNKAKSGHSDDPSKKYTKIAYMLIRNKEMIPNFKLAEKILNKAKHKSPLGIAINASITGDPRAGKPNATKAEKLFKEAMKQSSQIEIKELYADFLHSEDRDNKAEELGVDLNSAITTRPRKSKSTRTNDNHAQLTDGKDLYHIGYIKNNDKRYLERAANFGFPLAQSEYAHLIIKEQKKKEYKKALTYLQKSADEGILGCYKFGQMLAHGERTYTDLHQALKDAAEKGCGKAYYYIAKMMIEEHQYEAVLPIIEKGASKNHPKSVFIFGYLNMIEENKEVAEEFLSKGVNIAGNSTIAVKYGLLRLKGQVIEKNKEEAYKWFDFAHNT